MRAPRILNNWTIVDRLHLIKVPTLVLRGRKDIAQEFVQVPFFQNISNDIAGFQNRLGMFFFTLALFGFSCLSSLNLFANERILFISLIYVL